MNNTDNIHSAEWALGASIVVFGINYPVLKFLLEELSALPVNVLRFAVALVVLGLWYRRKLIRTLSEVMRRPFLLSMLALLGYFLSPLLLLYGLEYSTATNAAIILAGAPIWTAIISWVMNFERTGTYGWVGLLLSTMGLVLVGLSPELTGSIGEEELFGNVLLLLDSICWGSYVAFQRELLKSVDTVVATFWSLALVLPVFFVLSVPSLSFEVISGVSIGTWLGILFSGVFSMGFAHVWWSLGIREIGPTTVSIYGNGIPLVGVLASWFALGEPLTVIHFVGGVGLVGGAWLARMDRIQRGLRSLGVPES